MRYYFLGIAGTAMASLAALLKLKGHRVWGTDQGVYPPMSDFLHQHRIKVYQGYDKRHLAEPFDLSVIGNALSRGNEEVEEILDSGKPFTSLPELIRDEFIRKYHPVVVAGTHGKTTTTALLSWIFETAGLNPSFLIGGISRNFSSSIKLGRGDHFIIEGDEYDSAFFDKRAKFIHYFPRHLIINNIEYDHSDIYPDLEAIKNEFKKLLKIVPGQGLIVANGDDPAVAEVVHKHHSRLQLFGVNSQFEWSYVLHGINANETRFDLLHRGKFIDSFSIAHPGEHQVRNAVAAIAVCRDVGMEWGAIKSALASFSGVKRRLEYWGKLNGALVFDDFAHHPTAIRSTLRAVKELYPRQRLIALFEPRTNTTVTNIFQQELTEALSIAEDVWITPIHRPERVPPGQRISLDAISQALEKQNRSVILFDSYSQIREVVSARLKPDDVLVLLTNGSLGGEYVRLRELVS